MKRLLPILLLALLLPVPSWAAELGTDACSGSGDMGANWTVVTGMEMTQQGSGVCQPKTTNVTTSALYTAATFANDQYAQMKVVTAATNSARVVGVILRGTTAARTQYECRVAGPLGATATLSIVRLNAGTPTTVATTAADQTVSSGDTLYCDVVGSTLTLKINGNTLVGPTVDGTPIASGTPGMIHYSIGAVANSQTDDWAGGDVDASTPLQSTSGFLGNIIK